MKTQKKLTTTMKLIPGGIVAGGIAALIALGGCGKGEGNVTLKFSGTQTASLMDYLIPNAFAAVSEVKMCLKRLRFKQDDAAASSESDNIDFSPGLVTITSTGADIGTIVLPEGTYKRVEFDMEPDCDNAGTTTYAASFTGDNGSGSTTATTSIIFRGTFEADGSDTTLTLAVANIMSSLDTDITGAVGDSTLVKDALEAAGGTF